LGVESGGIVVHLLRLNKSTANAVCHSGHHGLFPENSCNFLSFFFAALRDFAALREKSVLSLGLPVTKGNFTQSRKVTQSRKGDPLTQRRKFEGRSSKVE
jgi:hypothetical protein